ncbi:MAG TPA: hypothetical protein VHE55_15030 [Fimbriimonadaceae bacterium]|nr:hypothetical protein [Fimbriimonadaceae bacterium]
MKPPIDNLQIAKPCPASWDEMSGDERVRHCALCRKNVYNLSAMSRDEIRRLIEEREGKFCARMFRRDDGKVMTSDCPKGLAKAGRRFAASLLASSAFVLTVGFSVARRVSRGSEQPTIDVQQMPMFQALSNWANGKKPSPPPTVTKPTPLMGDVMFIPPKSGRRGP